MKCVGDPWVSYMGILLILGSLAYFVISVAQVTAAIKSQQRANVVLRISQAVFVPFILFVSGMILFFQGWRQDPILQFKDVLMSILIGYLIFLDLKRSRPTRHP